MKSSTPNHRNNAPLKEIENNGKRAPQYIAALISSLACLSVGTTLGWSSQIANDLLSGKIGFQITEDELGWVGSLMYLGAATLSLFTGTIADLIGRKLLMLILVIPGTIGWCILIWANSASMLYCGRFITGMVAGSFPVLSSLYSSEIAQKEIRGALGSYTQLMISFGILFSCVMATLLDYKYYTMCCTAVPIVFAGLFVLMPETPVYLLQKNKVKDAYAALRQLRGKHYNADKEVIDIQDRLAAEQLLSGRNILLQSLKKRTTRKACLIGFGLMFFKSACGVDAFTTYTIYIFSNVDIGLNPAIAVIILNCCQVVAAVIQTFVVDRFGRRILLWVSGTIMALSLLTAGASFLLESRSLIPVEYYVFTKCLPMLAIVMFSISYSFGIGPIPFLLMGEIFPQNIKSVASSVATFVIWMTSFVVTKLFILVDSSWGGDIAFFIFAMFTFLQVLFVVVLVPETKNKSFDEIQNEL